MLRLLQLWQRVRDRVFTALVKGGFSAVGPRSVIQVPVRLAGVGRISVGSGVFVGGGSWLQVIGEGEGAPGPVIRIGDGCSFAGYVTVSAVSGVEIGEKVLVARYCYIADHAHASADPGTPVLDQGVTGVGPVRICDGAWLGQGVVVCPGVTIGCNAVIGANSVVRSDVPDFCVAAGVPARVIRRVDGKPIE